MCMCMCGIAITLLLFEEGFTSFLKTFFILLISSSSHSLLVPTHAPSFFLSFFLSFLFWVEESFKKKVVSFFFVMMHTHLSSL